MVDWKRVRIEDVCTIEKGVTGLAKAIPGDYPLVTTGAERKSSKDYQFDAKAVCIPLVSSTGHGKKTLNYVHYQEGKFALGSILAAVIPQNEKILSARYLHVYLQKNKDRVLVPLMKGAANVSLSVTAISNIEVPLPSLTEQKKLLDKIDSISGEHRDFLNEIDTQIGLFGELRQSILQEAIEGKLTAKWRKQNPKLISGDNHASKLLEKIKAEKEQLIKEGKIKKEKPFPPIADDEKPFDLPDGWVWRRLGDISLNVHYGFNASGRSEKKDVRLLRITDIQNNRVDWNGVPGCIYSARDIKSYLLSKNDIVIARTGGTIGKSFLIKDIPVQSLFASYLIRVIPSKNIFPEHLKHFFESPEYWKQLYDAAWGAGQPNVSGTSLSNLVVPLPSFAEQQAIVERVDKLTAMIDELEKQVTERKEQSGMLMQSVLREAFEKN
jgi:type I restriction enzyme S subunit